MSRPRGRPRIHPIVEPTPEPKPEAPTEINVRLGLKACMTSRGASLYGQKIHPGAIIALPAHEAENLVNLGYASHA